MLSDYAGQDGSVRVEETLCRMREILLPLGCWTACASTAVDLKKYNGH
jgi:hypothetical protein